MKKEKLNILVVGSGGREHAIVKALKRSPRTGKIYAAPGNAGIAEEAECVDISVTDVQALKELAFSENIDLTVVGPEASLAAGIADEFQSSGLRIFGPDRAAAQIESSKEFAKTLMQKYNIPTGGYRSFSDFEAAKEYVKNRTLPTVIKYDGLASGKGVVVAETYEEAEAALKDMLLNTAFGDGKVIIEEFLEGPEFSFMCVVSGNRVYPLALAQDHKRAFDGDKGPNTGGMGAYSPVPFISEKVRDEALEKIMKPAAAAMVEEGCPFTGVLYGGLILTSEGPKVIEFNARFGDPETEVVLPRLKSDLLELFEAALSGKDMTLEWSDESCLGIVLASEGYPGKYLKGSKISGLEKCSKDICHMGTSLDSEKGIVATGGRVLMVVGKGEDLKSARDKTLAEIREIDCPALFHRSDIGKQAIG